MNTRTSAALAAFVLAISRSSADDHRIDAVEVGISGVACAGTWLYCQRHLLVG
ncbi:MAG TPA: hypothetical protein VGD71_32760 [Kribbella sp.]|jgi:hypothetical protein